MTTHYIPPYTRRNGRKQETVCLRWVTAREHSNEPTCAECLVWLQQETKDTRTADERFGAEATR